MRRMMLGLLVALVGLGAARADDRPLRIGVTAGPVAQVVQFAAGLAKERGQRVEVVEFTDWVTPNEAVNAGDLDTNLFQHGAFLAVQNARRGTNLVQVDPVGLIAPIGLFSKKIRSLDAVPAGASVAIPNEPLNGARGLRLLEKAGLITLAPGKGLTVTRFDVTANPKKLDIVELDPAQLYRSLDDVTLAMVNLTYLLAAGGDPNTALLIDRAADDQFVLRFVAREDRKDDPRLRRFVETFKDPQVKAFIEQKLPGFVPAWPGA